MYDVSHMCNLKQQRSSEIQTTNWWLTEVIKEMSEGGHKVKRKKKGAQIWAPGGELWSHMSQGMALKKKKKVKKKRVGKIKVSSVFHPVWSVWSLPWSMTKKKKKKTPQWKSMLKWKSLKSCPTLCDPMDYTVYGSLQPRIWEWAAIPFSKV